MAQRKVYLFDATVQRVVDGDTVDLMVDLGFHVHVSVRTRLLGIDAPEVSTVEGRMVRDWLRDALPVGTPVIVETERAAGDKYGRWLATIAASCVRPELNPDGVATVNDLLVTRGFAVLYDGGARTTV